MPSNLTRGYTDFLHSSYQYNFDEEKPSIRLPICIAALMNVNGHADAACDGRGFLGVLQGTNTAPPCGVGR